MIKVVIVDDQELCRELLKDALKSFKKIKIIAECATADEAAGVLKKLTPDLVFLDVEMPGMTGIDLLNELEEISFETIFTTSHPDYAIQALKADALDYLLKPVEPTELAQALHKYALKRNKEKLSGQLEDFLKNENINRQQKKITVPTSNGFELLKIDDIIRLKAEINYTIIHLSDGRKLIVARTLKEYENILRQHDFIRIHNSHIINLSYLKRYVKGNGGVVHLEDGTQLDVSRQRKEEFLSALKSYES